MTDLTINTLDELLDAINRCGNFDQQDDSTTDAYNDWCALGLPVEHGVAALDMLPTFGGEYPDDTSEVYSWDATRLLISDGTGGFEIVDRS